VSWVKNIMNSSGLSGKTELSSCDLANGVIRNIIVYTIYQHQEETNYDSQWICAKNAR